MWLFPYEELGILEYFAVLKLGILEYFGKKDLGILEYFLNFAIKIKEL